jgi:hypothetical protein
MSANAVENRPKALQLGVELTTPVGRRATEESVRTVKSP